MTSRTGTQRIDDASFEALYRENYARVLAFALRRAGRATADDVVAQTFLIAWRRRDELVGDPLPWLLGVARRVLANQLRTLRRSEALAARARLDAGSREQGDVGDVLFLDAPIALALNSLPASDRETLLMTAWDGLSPMEAARVVGCSAPAFRVRLHRAKRRLEQALADLETDEARRAGSSAPLLASFGKGSR